MNFTGNMQEVYYTVIILVCLLWTVKLLGM